MHLFNKMLYSKWELYCKLISPRKLLISCDIESNTGPQTLDNIVETVPRIPPVVLLQSRLAERGFIIVRCWWCRWSNEGFAPFNLISPLYTEINYTTINIGHVDEEHYVSTFWIINYLTFINESDGCCDNLNSHMNYIAGSKPYLLIAAYAICSCFIKSFGYCRIMYH